MSEAKTVNQVIDGLQEKGLTEKDKRDLLRRGLRICRDMPHEIADLILLELTTAEADTVQKGIRRKI